MLLKKHSASICASILAVFFSAVFLLTGCSGGTGSAPPSPEEVASLFSGSFSADAETTLTLPQSDEPLILSLSITRHEDCCLIETTAPEYLSGLSFSIDGMGAPADQRTLTVRYKEITIEPDALPEAALGSALADVFTALSSPEALSVSETSEGWCASGSTETLGDFDLLIGNETRLPSGLTLPEAGIGIQFLSFDAMETFRPERIEEDFAPSDSSEPSGRSEPYPSETPEETSL